MNRESQKTLTRLLKELDFSDLTKTGEKEFIERLNNNFMNLFSLLHEVYGHRYDFYYHLKVLINNLKTGFKNRKPSLKRKDKQRLKAPDWFKQEDMVGISCYVDLFAGDLKKLQNKIPYLKDFGITYLHLMPLYKSPDGDSDGGYAVSDYRKVNENLGSVEDLAEFSEALSKAGINLALDFVFNHTADEHEWAMRAKAGAQDYQDYYWMFDNKDIPNEYEKNLREIFPQVRRGSFTYNEQAKKWVWTTFNSFQWDLNYANPEVFNVIADEMLFLANLGCDALRLDALAFIWKEMGTDCENRPKAHTLIRAFNSCLKIVSPAVVFKSEAIVHPDEVLKYINKNECELSYNPLLMALIWDSLATRKTNLLTNSMQKSFQISSDCAWINYARCHDDIGWTFDDSVAGSLAINSYDHRYFLNQFYTGRFEGSFSTGVAFAENPLTGDCRVCGSLASLAGLEQALKLNDQTLIENAVKRILLIHSIILSIGGIPLLYSGDELGLLNDYEYKNDPAKVHDDRWVNRIALHEADVAKSQETDSPFYNVRNGLQGMISKRKENAIFGSAPTQILNLNNPHVFAYQRSASNFSSTDERLMALCNFSEHQQSVQLASSPILDSMTTKDLITNRVYAESPKQLSLEPYQVIWLHIS